MIDKTVTSSLMFSHSDARVHGMSPAMRLRTVVKVRRGVYLPTDLWKKLRPFQRYELRVRTAATVLQDAVFALESAASIHDLPVFGEPEFIHLFQQDLLRGYSKDRHAVHTSSDPKEATLVDGIQVTSLTDTTLDLVRVLPYALGVAVVDAALRRGVALEDLRAKLATQANRRGRALARRTLAAADALAESALESLSRVVIQALGYATPELQVGFDLRSGKARVDFFWRAERLVGEADGNGKYFGQALPTAEVVREERRRENEIRRTVRGVARWEWADVATPSRLDAILQAAGLRRVRPPDPALAGMLSNSRASLNSAR